VRPVADRATDLRRRFPRLPGTVWGEVLFVPLALLALGVYLALTNQYFLTGSNLKNILLQGATLAVVSYGVTFVVLAGDLDLSVGSGAALASVIGAFVMRDTGSVALGGLVGIGVGLAIGLFNGLVITRLEVPSFIATLGTLVIARGLALASTNGSVVTGLPTSVGTLATNQLLGIPYIVWIVFVVVFLALYFVQTQTAFGVRVFAVGGNREAARLSAVPVERIRLICFLISGVTMGIAGLVLTARVQSGQPNAGDSLELYAVAAIVLGGTSLYGGRGSLARTMWGVLFIVTLQNGLDLNAVNDDVKPVIIGLVLIAAASADFVRARLRRRRAVREETAAGSSGDPGGQPLVAGAAEHAGAGAGASGPTSA
jgi:ribose/xylose/arabinose/galactoside ABC-type transport system permease subunit